MNKSGLYRVEAREMDTGRRFEARMAATAHSTIHRRTRVVLSHLPDVTVGRVIFTVSRAPLDPAWPMNGLLEFTELFDEG